MSNLHSPPKMKNAPTDGNRESVQSNSEAAKLHHQSYPKGGEIDKHKVLSPQQRWRKRNPKSYLAHLAVQNALKLGVLERQPCRECGIAKSEAHHPDYERPFDVIWLCRKHHKALHAADAEA